MKTATVVDMVRLTQCIIKVEQNGPLPNRNMLYDAVALEYNDPKVTKSVVMLRITNTPNLLASIKTPKGKKGRVKGQKVGPINRTKRKDKINVDVMDVLRKSVPANYISLVDRIASGSLKAAIKLNCLSCVGFERKVKLNDNDKTATVDTIGDCTVTSCPMWSFRPYQK